MQIVNGVPRASQRLRQLWAVVLPVPWLLIRVHASDDSVRFAATVWILNATGARFPMSLETVNVGPFEIEVSGNHIYLYPHLPSTYDYVPWNVIHHIIAKANLFGATLIDVGANVGDTLAHFRRFSEAPVLCVEPAQNFYDILERNSQQFSNVTLIKKLVVPDDLVGRVSFLSGEQTGASKASSEGDVSWAGEYTTFTELFSSGAGPFIIKSDTDGFDANIIGSALPHISAGSADVPIIFFEGPSEDQMRNGDYLDYIDLCQDLIDLGYSLLTLTNIGMPYAFSDTKISITAVFEALGAGYRKGLPLCHYYDFIAIQNKYVSDEVSLCSPWGGEFFERS